jgi:hypothetical protein
MRRSQMKVGLDDGRLKLAEELRRRRDEIGSAVTTRVYAVEPPPQSDDPEYAEGLRAAITIAVEHTIDACERTGDTVHAVPTAIISQARLAAHRRIPLQTMLRRYLAGHSVLTDLVVEEAGRQNLDAGLLRVVLRSQAARTDHVLMAISAAYVEETTVNRPLSSDRRKADHVQRLLDGELIDPSEIDYDFDRWHVALIGRGPRADRVMRAIIERIDARRLLVLASDDLVWAWVGAKGKLDPRQIEAAAPSRLPKRVCVAVGEAAKGRIGWQLTHRQARAALSVPASGSGAIVRYADVALVAVAMHDELFTTSARRLYLEPLSTGRDGGRSLLETLRAFFAAQQNVSSTAAALGVTRQTVANRLRTVELLINRPLSSCSAELQAVLRLQTGGLDPQGAVTRPTS